MNPCEQLSFCTGLTLYALSATQDIKMWRLKCLKEMTAVSKRPTISKWGNVARAFRISDNKGDGSEDMNMIDSQPPLLRQELLVTSSSTKTLKLKSSVDCFLNVLDLEPRDENEERVSVITTSRSNATRDVSIEAPRSHKTIAISSAPATKISRKKPAKQLNDKLSRRRIGANASGSSPWRFETSAVQDVFTPERSDFNASALPSTIALASGVNLLQGESKIEGPEPAESGATMSKKRFDVRSCCDLSGEMCLILWKYVAPSAASDRFPLSCGGIGAIRGQVSTSVKSWIASVPRAFRAIQTGRRGAC